VVEILHRVFSLTLIKDQGEYIQRCWTISKKIAVSCSYLKDLTEADTEPVILTYQQKLFEMKIILLNFVSIA